MLFRARVLQAACACIAAVLSVVPAATITLDEQTEHQTIAGLGGHNPGGQATTLVNDLGLSAHRAEIMPDGSSLPSWSDMKQLADLGVTCFIGCPWSPPAAFKTNGSTTDGGSLKTNMYDDFAQFMATWVKKFKTEVGIDLYAISPQNEPRFAQSFRSCVYTPEQMRDVVIAIGQEFAAQGLTTKILVADDMLAVWKTVPMMQVSVADPTAGPYVHGLAVHGYSNGVNPTPSAEAAAYWGTGRGLSDYALATGKTTWMTETSGYWNNWTDGMDLASTIYIALKYGKISGWFWWRLAVTQSYWEDEALILNGNKLTNYYVHKHYYKWIRPGAVQIDATSDDDYVHCVAFNHKQNNTLTLVVLNWADAAKTVTISGNSLPSQFDRYLSTSSNNCASQGTIGPSSISLPGKSVTTLYGTGYDPVVSVEPLAPAMVRSATPVESARMRVYALDGTLLRELHDAASWDGRDADGRVLARGSCYGVLLDNTGRVVGTRRMMDEF